MKGSFFWLALSGVEVGNTWSVLARTNFRLVCLCSRADTENKHTYAHSQLHAIPSVTGKLWAIAVHLFRFAKEVAGIVQSIPYGVRTMLLLR